MKRPLLLIGIVMGITIGWLVSDFPALDRAQAAPITTTKANPPGKANTGAPPGEGTCADCHGTGADNTGPGSITLTVPLTYTPGQTYHLVVALVSTGATRWGFEATALTAAEAMAGSFGNTTGLTGTQTQASTGRMYVNQVTGPPDGTYAGTPSPVSWMFDWVAPAQGTGTVTFYVAGVAANNDGGADNGDLTYISTATSAEDTGTPVAPVTWGIIKNRYR